MPGYPQSVRGLPECGGLGRLAGDGCREWRPRDFGAAAPVKALKRGPDFPMVVEIVLDRRGKVG